MKIKNARQTAATDRMRRSKDMKMMKIIILEKGGEERNEGKKRKTRMVRNRASKHIRYLIIIPCCPPNKTMSNPIALDVSRSAGV